MSSKKGRANGWPDHVHADVSLDGYFERMDAVRRVLAEKAGLQKAEVSAALTSADPRTKEKGAKWLRSELQRLRDAQKSGGHPARRGTTLSLLEIADVAFTLLEAINSVDDELLSLLQELLNLDRHRRMLGANVEAFDLAANSEAQQTLQGRAPGVRELARENSISVSTASQWKRSSEYRNKVEFYRSAWTDRLGGLVGVIKQKRPDIPEAEAFRIAMLLTAFPSLASPSAEPGIRTLASRGALRVSKWLTRVAEVCCDVGLEDLRGELTAELHKMSKTIAPRRPKVAPPD